MGPPNRVLKSALSRLRLEVLGTIQIAKTRPCPHALASANSVGTTTEALQSVCTRCRRIAVRETLQHRTENDHEPRTSILA
jgi:hypothetical protein